MRHTPKLYMLFRNHKIKVEIRTIVAIINANEEMVIEKETLEIPKIKVDCTNIY